MLRNLALGYIQVQAKQMKIERILTLVRVQDHFWKLSVDMDEQLFFLAWVEEDVHLSHSFELLESISVHGYVSG